MPARCLPPLPRGPGEGGWDFRAHGQPFHLLSHPHQRGEGRVSGRTAVSAQVVAGASRQGRGCPRSPRGDPPLVSPGLLRMNPLLKTERQGPAPQFVPMNPHRDLAWSVPTQRGHQFLHPLASHRAVEVMPAGSQDTSLSALGFTPRAQDSLGLTSKPLPVHTVQKHEGTARGRRDA